MPNEVSLNIDKIANRSRLQYLTAPFKSFFVALGLIIVLSVTAGSNFGKTILHNLGLDELDGSHDTISMDHKTKSSAQPAIDTEQIKINANQLDEQLKLQEFTVDGFKVILILITFSVAFTLFGAYSVALSFTQGLFTAMIILFTKRYPNWLYEWNKGVINYFVNFNLYNWLITDQFPDICGEKSQMQLILPNPADEELSRLKPLIKWLLSIFQLMIIGITRLLLIVMQILIWPYLLITGCQYPNRVKAFICGFIEWELSVYSYATLLFTDKYPSFTFKSKFD